MTQSGAAFFVQFVWFTEQPQPVITDQADSFHAENLSLIPAITHISYWWLQKWYRVKTALLHQEKWAHKAFTNKGLHDTKMSHFHVIL